MLADNLAESVANRATAVPVGGCGGNFFDSDELARFGEGADFFDGTDSDPVGFAQSTVNGASLGDSHLGSLDEKGNIGGVGVAVADKAFAGSG